MAIYNPPFESPIEYDFAWAIVKYLKPEVILNKQVETNTFVGIFRLDFVAERGDVKIAFECDGKEYHDYTRDMFRDSIILGCSDIDAIYRIPGADITYFLNDALHAIGCAEPTLFTERGLGILNRISSPISEEGIRDYEEYIIRPPKEDQRWIWIRALRKSHPNPVWKRLYNYAHAHQHLTLEQIIEKSDRDGLKWFSE